MMLFETMSLFILRETTPEILGPSEELEFTDGYYIIVFKFSTSTTNSFSVFPTTQG